MSGGGPEEIVIPALLAAVVEDRVAALVPALGPAADFIYTSVSVPENLALRVSDCYVLVILNNCE